MTLPPGGTRDMHGRQLVTRLGMAASPGSRGPVTTARTAAGTTPTGRVSAANQERVAGGRVPVRVHTDGDRFGTVGDEDEDVRVRLQPSAGNEPPAVSVGTDAGRLGGRHRERGGRHGE